MQPEPRLFPPTFRLVRPLFVALAIVLVPVSVAHAAGPEVVAFDVRLSGLGTFIDGDESRFQSRHQVRSGGSGGIEDFYLEALVGDNRDIKLEGRALIDNHDYLARLLLRQEDLGYIDAGYREFRHWYDGSGGFFPPTAAYFSVFDDELSVDRASAWFETGLRMPKVPKVTLRYAHDTRDGRVNSLAWGVTNETDGRGPRSIVPAFTAVDERRDRIAVDIEHKVRRTMTLGGGLRWDSSRNQAARNMSQQPMEALAERFLTHDETTKSDLLNLRAYSLNSLTRQRTQVTTAYSYTDLDSSVGGSRIFGDRYGAEFDPAFVNRRANDLGFNALTGSSRLQEHVGTLNALYLPTRTMRVRAAVRVGRRDTEASSRQTATAVESSGVLPFLRTSELPLVGLGNAGTTRINEQLEVRYFGIKKTVLHARADFEQRRGDLLESLRGVSSDLERVARDSKIDGFDQRYAAGATYYPVRRVTISAKGYFDRRQADYRHHSDNTDNSSTSPDRFPAYIRATDTDRVGTQAAATWSLASAVRLRGTYDFLHSTIDARVDELRRIKSGTIESHVFGGSATWSPGSTYLHGTGSYVLNERRTPARALSGPAGQVAVTVPNDYISLQLLSGIAISAATDLNAMYSLYWADNYRNNAAFSQPFGATAEEHGLSVGVRHRLSEVLEGSLRYGFLTSDNDETGGFDDFDGHFVHAAVQYSF